jgi:hypothetical protein
LPASLLIAQGIGQDQALRHALSASSLRCL